MGNTICTLGLADCFRPSVDCDEEYIINTNYSKYNQSCDIFTISQFNNYDLLSSTKTYTSMNDLQLNNDLIDMNITKLSKNLSSSSSSVYTMDSGYESCTTSNDSTLEINNNEMVEINLESISQYSARNSSLSHKASFNFDLLYTSLFNMSYLLNNSFNKFIKKSTSKTSIFTSKFITTMKAKLDKQSKRITYTEEYIQSSNQQAVDTELDTKSNISIISTLSVNSNSINPLSLFQITSLQNFVSRIYDVNQF